MFSDFDDQPRCIPIGVGTQCPPIAVPEQVNTFAGHTLTTPAGAIKNGLEFIGPPPFNVSGEKIILSLALDLSINTVTSVSPATPYYAPPTLVSFRFVSFRFVSFRFVSFRFCSNLFHFILFFIKLIECLRRAADDPHLFTFHLRLSSGYTVSVQYIDQAIIDNSIPPPSLKSPNAPSNKPDDHVFLTQ